jgi:hypothetical protein
MLKRIVVVAVPAIENVAGKLFASLNKIVGVSK